jgi:hypothetical protein
MTKKDFTFIASTIAAMPTFSPALRDQRRSCALAFATALASTNPRFDRDRFLRAACPVNVDVNADLFPPRH